MIEWLRQALALLSPEERRQYWRLQVLSAISAVAQTVAIFSIMPFIVLIANPEFLDTNLLLMRASAAIGADSYEHFLAILGSAGILALVIGNAVAALDYWLSHRYLCRLGHRLEKQTLSSMLRRPYEFFVERHSGDLGNVVWNQVERVVDGVIGTSIAIVGSSALVVFIVAVLLVINPLTTIITLLGLTTLYLGVFLLLRRRIAEHGENLTELSGDLTVAVTETLEGVKEIKTRSAEDYFVSRFERSSLPLSRLALRFGILSFLPNFVLETLVIGALVGAALYFMLTTQDAGTALSYIALYGMATYRLVPSLRGVFEGIAELQHNVDAVRVVAEFRDTSEQSVVRRSLPRLTNEIRFENVSFQYNNSDRPQIQGASFTIPVGSSLCLFGPSGSGKSTLLNLLVGLIYPRQGQVFCDGTAISAATVDAWRATIGYCPQQVYLFDDSVASNIAFGVERESIDIERVRSVCGLANIDNFANRGGSGVAAQWVGDSGVTLSGGQQQRIGIARALYPDPDIIVLDEVFAGLDVSNRNSILDRLFQLEGKTLVFSSHDPEVAARCDNVIVLQDGGIVSEGHYEAVKK